MEKIMPITTLRKSVAILVSKLAALQLVVMFTYIILRLSKYWVFRQLFTYDDYHNLKFWLGIAIFVVVVLIQTALIVWLTLSWFYEYYEVRKDVIIHTKGVIKRTEDIYSLKTIEAGNATQSFIGRLLGYGTVRIYSPVLKREYFLHDIPNPGYVKDTVLSLLGGRHDERRIIPKDRQK